MQRLEVSGAVRPIYGVVRRQMVKEVQRKKKKKIYIYINIYIYRCSDKFHF